MVFDEICVLANGDIVCSCGDPAGLRVYGNVFRDRIADVYDGALYHDIRRWQLASRPESWCPITGEACGGRVSRAVASDLPSGRVVRLLQLEPVSHCNLSCPGCPATRLSEGDPHYAADRASRLPLDVMVDVVEQLPMLETLLFYNFGEPFLHTEAVAFLRAARRSVPLCSIRTSTNGSAMSKAQIQAVASEALVDQIVFSIDGAFEGSYRHYRKGGSLEQALSTLREFVQVRDAAGTRDLVDVKWQYILFEWNDSDEELRRAQQLAREIGVELKWVTTHTEGASKKFRFGSEALERLIEGDAYESMTCELRRQDLTVEGGAAGLRYSAHLESDLTRIRGRAGECSMIPLRVRNSSAQPWQVAGARAIRLGTRLRNSDSPGTLEGSSMRLSGEPVAPGASRELLLPLILPQRAGRWEVIVDMVEDGVCWFSERGGTALSLTLDVDAAGAGAGADGPTSAEPRGSDGAAAERSTRRVTLSSPVRRVAGGPKDRRFVPMSVENLGEQRISSGSLSRLYVAVKAHPIGGSGALLARPTPVPVDSLAPRFRYNLILDLELPHRTGEWVLEVELVEAGGRPVVEDGMAATSLFASVSARGVQPWDPESFVRTMHQVMLNHPPLKKDEEWWCRRLCEGATVEDMIVALERSMHPKCDPILVRIAAARALGERFCRFDLVEESVEVAQRAQAGLASRVQGTRL